MLEQLRHQYLSVFGIEQYVPKRQLMGAKPSVAMPDVLTAPDKSFINTGRASGFSNIDKTASDHLDSKTAKPLSATRDQVGHTRSKGLTSDLSPAPDIGVEKTKPSSTVSKDITFVLNVWRIAEDCLVLDSRQPGTALPTDRLLQNMLRAIGYPLVQLPTSEAIRWPLFKNDQNSQDKARARSMVQAFIHAQYCKAPLKTLILMGEKASQYALDEEQMMGKTFSALCETMPVHSQWPLNIVITPSLHEMLQEPKLKATAWKSLRRLPTSVDR